MESEQMTADQTPASLRRAQCVAISAFVLERGLDGATSDEVEAALNLSHQTCSARFTDLKRDGVIIEIKKLQHDGLLRDESPTRLTKRGKPAAVCVHERWKKQTRSRQVN